jgi:hypothetical protein
LLLAINGGNLMQESQEQSQWIAILNLVQKRWSNVEFSCKFQYFMHHLGVQLRILDLWSANISLLLSA